MGHPCTFQRVSHLGSVTARHSSIGRQPNFAALNRGRHLYSAGRPSRWALAHISSLFMTQSAVLILCNGLNSAREYFYRQKTLELNQTYSVGSVTLLLCDTLYLFAVSRTQYQFTSLASMHGGFNSLSPVLSSENTFHKVCILFTFGHVSCTHTVLERIRGFTAMRCINL